MSTWHEVHFTIFDNKSKVFLLFSLYIRYLRSMESAEKLIGAREATLCRPSPEITIHHTMPAMGVWRLGQCSFRGNTLPAPGGTEALVDNVVSSAAFEVAQWGTWVGTEAAGSISIWSTNKKKSLDLAWLWICNRVLASSIERISNRKKTEKVAAVLMVTRSMKAVTWLRCVGSWRKV